MNTTLKRSLTIALSIAVVVAFSVMLPTGQAAAKSKKMKLPTKIVYQSKTDGKWVTEETYTYKYNKKGDLIKITKVGDKDDGPFTIKYTYKKGKKVSGKGSDKNAKNTYKFNKKGQLINMTRNDEDSKITRAFSYNKKGYLTAIKWTDKNNEYYNTKDTDKYVTRIKGGKATITVTGKDFYNNKWKEVRTYNKAGLLKKVTVYGDSPSHEDVEYTYKIKKKLVTARYWTNEEGDEIRTVYTYGKAKAPASRYYKIINEDERVVVSNRY